MGGPRERVLLASLALRVNQVVSMDYLVDAIWQDDPPTSARSQIQACVSGLRKLFREVGQPGTIETSPPGYLLALPPGELDIEEFTRLVAEARGKAGEGMTAEAADLLRSALALWRGRALDGLRSDVLQRSAARLEEARLAAVEERVRLDLELGEHEKICGDLRALVEENPLSERLYRFLMLALYRSGRQVEALEVARNARATLIDEVGIEPGQELRDLEAAILNRDPALDPQRVSAGSLAAADAPAEVAERVTPRQLPGSTADFIGRERHIVEIKRLLSGEDPDAMPYALRIVAISGRGGVGKSTLALRAAHELSDDFPDGHLYADLHGMGDEDRTPQVLARFLHSLGVTGAAMPDDPHERTLLYRSILANRRLLVVLDDVRNEEQVFPLLPGSPTCAVLATSRMRLTGLTGAARIHVDVFKTDKSMELLGRIVGGDRVATEQEDAIELVNLCGGLPLALRIAGARLASRPHWRIADLVRRLGDEANRLDEFSHRGLELRSSIGLTYRSLPSQAQRLFRLFALNYAPDFPGWTAAALLDMDLFGAEDVLARLVDAQLLDTVEYPGEHVRYRFHDLVRIYALELLGEAEPEAERRQALERLLGAWMALAEQAHRAEYGGDYTLLHGKAPRWRPVDWSGVDPSGNPGLWWESERRNIVAAVRQAATAGMHELSWDLVLTSMSLFEVKGYFDDWRETTQLALDSATKAGNRVGEAAMLYSFGNLHMLQKRLDAAEKCFTSALERFEAEGYTHGRALVLRDMTSVDRMRGNFAGMLAKSEMALELMREVGDLVSEAALLRGMAKYLIDEGELDRARPMLTRALEICRQAQHLRGEAQVLNRLAELHLGTGEVALARQELHNVLRIAREISDRIGEAHALYGLGMVRRREGRLDDARSTLGYALAMARQVGERLIEAMTCHAIAEIELARGDGPAAVEYVDAARKLFSGLGSPLWHAKALTLLAEVYEMDGDAERSLECLDEAAPILSAMDSRAAARLLSQVENTRTALRPGPSFGRSADTG
ncbi:BTAD domain-containing putative transcriptional regulator [Actinocrispum sp. NPDC049592]|uniref:AfsR/SARP family transcriptional regulator n=1 Tax=Actinocrispum sp. NPDC049592 TaxID=3154835 RepID=UPI003429F4FF